MKGFARAYLEEEEKILDKVPLTNLATLIDLIQRAHKDEKHTFIMGNGGRVHSIGPCL